MNRRVSTPLCLVVALAFTELAAMAQTTNDSAPATVVRFARDVPRNLATVYSGTARGEVAQAFSIRAPGLAPRDIAVQRENNSTRTWFIASLEDPSIVGTTRTFPARPLEVRPLEVGPLEVGPLEAGPLEAGPLEAEALGPKPPAVNHIVSIHDVAGGLQVQDHGRPVLVYATTPRSHEGKFVTNGFVHPLYGLGGEELVQLFPLDHRHHRGIFWAWHQLWVGDHRAGDSWVNEDFLTEVKESRVIDQGPVFAALQARLHWTSPKVVDENGEPRAFVEETTTIRVYHATASTQLVDFEIQLKPLLDDVRLGGAENARGYSGFTVRVRPPRGMKLLTDSDALASDAIGTQSRWADVSGQFSADDTLSGIAILSHRSLAEFPPRWLLRFYGMQNVVYPGREPVRLSADAPLVLRHRLVIHRGDANTARIADQQRVYEMGP